MLGSYFKKLTSTVGSYFEKSSPNHMATTCILVVGLPMALCMFFVIYAIFIVPGLEKPLQDGVDLPGGHHLAPREYLYLVYWAVAASIMVISTSLGIVKLCKCKVKDFEEQYGSPPVAVKVAGGKIGAFGGGGSGTSRTPTMSTILTERSPLTLRQPPCPLVTAIPLPVQPPVTSLPMAMPPVVSPPVSEPGSAAINRGFVFSDEDDDDDELARVLEMRLRTARVLPLAKSFDPIGDSEYGTNAAGDRRASRAKKVTSLVHPDLGRRGSQMGQRWRSMPLERGFSLTWDDDLGLDDVQLPDGTTTPEDVAAFSPELITEDEEDVDESQKYRRRAEWIGTASISLEDETAQKPSSSRAGSRKKRLSVSGVTAAVEDDPKSLSSSSDSFGSLLEPKRLFSVTEATALPPGSAITSSTKAAIARAMALASSSSSATFPTTFEEDEAEAEIRQVESVLARRTNVSKGENYWHLVDLETPGGDAMSPPPMASATPAGVFTATGEEFDFAKSGLFDFPETSSSSGRNGASSRENSNGNGPKNV